MSSQSHRPRSASGRTNSSGDGDVAEQGGPSNSEVAVGLSQWEELKAELDAGIPNKRWTTSLIEQIDAFYIHELRENPAYVDLLWEVLGPRQLDKVRERFKEVCGAEVMDNTEILDLLMNDPSIAAGVEDWKEGQADHMSRKGLEFAESEAYRADQDSEYEGDTREFYSKRTNPDAFRVALSDTTVDLGMFNRERVKLKVRFRNPGRLHTNAVDAGYLWTYWRGFVGAMYDFTLQGEYSDAVRATWSELGSDGFEARIFGADSDTVVGEPEIEWKKF